MQDQEYNIRSLDLPVKVFSNVFQRFWSGKYYSSAARLVEGNMHDR